MKGRLRLMRQGSKHTERALADVPPEELQRRAMHATPSTATKTAKAEPKTAKR